MNARSPHHHRISAPGRFSLKLGEIWRYRELFYIFTWRDIKVKYKQTALGFLWAILQPVLMMLVLSGIFGSALNVDSDGIPYPIFVYSGLLFWGIFSSGLNGAANSMISNANLLKKIYFPRLILPMSSVLVAVFDFLMALLVYFFLLLYFDQSVHLGKLLICLPAGLFLTVITTFGLGSMLAAWNVKYRDFRYIVPFLIQFLLFVNPIIYSTSIFDGTWAEYAIAANPMAGAIDLSRYAFLDQPMEYDLLAISFTSAIILLISGVYFFRRSESYFADLV